MIVKVQLSLFTTCLAPQVLVCNEDKTIKFEGPATQEIIKRMNGSVKNFFYSELVDTIIEINEEAPWQEW